MHDRGRTRLTALRLTALRLTALIAAAGAIAAGALAAGALAADTSNAAAADTKPSHNYRRPTTDGELRYWLGNMIWYHRFSDDEVAQATGLSMDEIAAAKARFDIRPDNRPPRPPGAPLLVMPYPGGRHPRIGFLDGAVNPQRESKVSIFTPWDPDSYVVTDVPEAIWSNLGLTYLAHTHVPTIWTKQNVAMQRLEWNRRADGGFDITRRLPNGIVFSATVMPGPDAVRMQLTLTNGTDAKLSDLRVQNCAMLKGAKGFAALNNDNKVFASPYTAVHSADGKQWIIWAWDPCHHPWANASVPCLHSDPKFPDCDPGQTVKVRGWLCFYEGDDIQAEFARIEKTGWRSAAP